MQRPRIQTKIVMTSEKCALPGTWIPKDEEINELIDSTIYLIERNIAYFFENNMPQYTMSVVHASRLLIYHSLISVYRCSISHKIYTFCCTLFYCCKVRSSRLIHVIHLLVSIMVNLLMQPCDSTHLYNVIIRVAVKSTNTLSQKKAKLCAKSTGFTSANKDIDATMSA